MSRNNFPGAILADKLVKAYNDGDKSVKDYLETLGTIQVAELIQFFERESALGKETSVSLLKVLLLSRKIRGIVLQKAIDLIRSNAIQG